MLENGEIEKSRFRAVPSFSHPTENSKYNLNRGK